MKVLLIQAPLGREHKPVYPLGLACLAGALAGKHQVEILDANCQAEQELQETITGFKPDVIGLGLRNIDNSVSYDPYFYFRHFPPFAAWIRQLSTKSTLVVGGSGFSLFPREVMEACPEIDHGVELEGEETFPALLDNLGHPETVPGVYYRSGNHVLYSGASDLPDYVTLPLPQRLLDPGLYQDEISQMGVQTKRGCNQQCLYCNYPHLNGRRLRLRPPRSVVDELERLEKELGMKGFAFSDGMFNEPREHAEEICREMLMRHLRLKWTAYYSVGSFDYSLLELATRAGCQLFEFSPDGIRQPTLDALQKGITMGQLCQVMDLFKGSDYPEFALNLMFNVPNAKFRDLILLSRAIYLWPRKYPSLRFVAVTNMRIYPNTPIHDHAVQEGVVSPTDNLIQPIFYNPWPLKPFSVALAFLTYFKGKNNWRLRLWHLKQLLRNA